MATGDSPVRDAAFYKKVINKCRLTFIADLDPVSLLDVFLVEEYLTPTQARDIKELATTSDMNREIVAKVSSKGVKGYQKFKLCLIKSSQEHLAETLEEAEKAKLEEDTQAARVHITGFKCSVCDLSYSTVQLLTQHTETREHLSMIEDQQDFAKDLPPDDETETNKSEILVNTTEHITVGPDFKGNRCYICNVNFTSVSHAESHFSGNKHRKKKTLFDATRKHTLPEQTGSLSLVESIGNENNLPSEENNFNQPDGHVSTLSYTPDKTKSSPSIDSNNMSLKCEICEVPFSSQYNAQQHYDSERHKKKKQLLEKQKFGDDKETGNSEILVSTTQPIPIGFAGQGHRCDICNVNFTSITHAESHFSGKQHKKKKTLFDLTQKQPLPELTGSFSLVDSIGNKNNLQSEENNFNQPDGHVLSMLDTPDSTKPIAMMDSNNMSLKCVICEVPFSSHYNAQQHYDSEKHKKKQQLLEKQKLGELLPLSCDICRCKFPGQESAEAHFKSEKHKRKENKAKEDEPESLGLYCEICNCPFSCEENAKQHYEGRQHRRKAGLYGSGNTSILDTSTSLDDVDKPMQSTENAEHKPGIEGEDSKNARDEDDEVAANLEKLSLHDK